MAIKDNRKFARLYDLARADNNHMNILKQQLDARKSTCMENIQALKALPGYDNHLDQDEKNEMDTIERNLNNN